MKYNWENLCKLKLVTGSILLSFCNNRYSITNLYITKKQKFTTITYKFLKHSCKELKLNIFLSTEFKNKL